MGKILRRSGLMLTVFVGMLLWLSPAALAATGSSQTVTPIAGVGSVVITNNYGIADIIELTLSSTPSDANAVYWVYLPGATDKSAQLGVITVKKGTNTGKMTVGAGKLKDYSAGYVNITNGTALHRCDYDKANETAPFDTGKVTLRNADNAASLLVVEQNAVIPGMTVTAIVGGKMYKGTAKNNSADFQLSLAKGLEVGTPVWYTVAAPGCIDIGYDNKLSLQEVAISPALLATNIRVFFQGADKTTSSIMVFGLSPTDVVRCYGGSAQPKSATVLSGSTTVTITGLAAGNVTLTLTQKGNKESAPLPVSISGDIASAPLKSADVTVKNTVASGATFTVSTTTEPKLDVGDVIKVYDAQGNFLATATAADTADYVADPNATPLIVAEVKNLNLGDKATTVYISVTRGVGSGESTWLSVRVIAPTP